MTYERIRTAQFLLRENRFTAQVLLDGEPVRAHVKNTGRCAELLTPNATVYLAGAENPARKTGWDLVAVEKGPLLINMDSAAPNRAAGEWLAAGGLGRLEGLRPEYTVGDSRFDFRLEDGQGPIFVEVKGVTLEEAGEVRFPDAPTERGIKHIHELEAAKAEGYDAGILFVVQMERALYFEPNYVTHPKFGEALYEASKKEIHITAMLCHVEENGMWLTDKIPVKLQ